MKTRTQFCSLRKTKNRNKGQSIAFLLLLFFILLLRLNISCDSVYASYDVDQWQTINGVKQERCTYRVWHEAYDRLGIELPINWGNAVSWAANARNAGYQVDFTPSVNSIVCWSGGTYGHVAYITGIDSTYIYIREAGLNPVNGQYYFDHEYKLSNPNRWNGYTLEGYIHLAEQEPVIAGTCGTNVAYYYKDGTIVFTKEDDESAAEFNSNCVSVFKNDSNVTKVKIDDSMSINNDGSAWGLFGNLSYITEMDLSNLNVSAVTGFTHMFYGSSSITRLNLSNWDTSNVTGMSEMFRGCSALMSLDVSGWNTSNVIDMGGMFDGCSALTSLDISGWDISNVREPYYSGGYINHGYVFRNCDSLKEIKLGQNSVQTAIFDEIKDRAWTYREAAAAASNPLPLGTVKRSALFRSYDPASMAGTWVVSDDVEALQTCGLASYYYQDQGATIVFTTDYHWTEATFDNYCVDVFRNDPNVTKVVIDAPMRLGTWINPLFLNASYIREMYLSNLDISAITRLSGLFTGCTSLQKIDMSGWNTSNIIDMSYLFSGCSSLQDIKINGWNTTAVTTMQGMFIGCSALTELDLSSFNTTAVTNMSQMFSQCSGLVDLDLGSFNTSNVTAMWSMFYGCSGLTSLNLSNFNTSNVTAMFSMFNGCSGLTSLDLSNFDTSGVTDMSYMFSRCSGLSSLNISSFDTSNATDMRGMFSGCSGLTGLDLLNFDTSVATDMSYMFYGCSGLTGLDLSNFNTSNVTSMGLMFDGCTGLTGLNLNGFDTSNVANMVAMFSGCSGLTGLNLSSFDTSNVTNMGSMFDGCSGLTSLDVSNFNTSNVTDMGVMFRGCSGLTTLDLSNFNTFNVTDMSQMFEGCSSLVSLNVSGWNTVNVTNIGDMFYNCSALTALDLSNFDTSNVTYMGGTFRGCSSLKEIKLGTNSVRTNIYSHIANRSWAYITADASATNPLPLGTVKGNALFTEYDPTTMAGVWSTESAPTPDPEDPVMKVSVTASAAYDHCQVVKQLFSVSLPEPIYISAGTTLYAGQNGSVTVQNTDDESSVEENDFWFLTRKCTDANCTHLTKTSAFPYTLTNGFVPSVTYKYSSLEDGTTSLFKMKVYGHINLTGTATIPFPITNLTFLVEEPGTYVIYAFAPYSEKDKIEPETCYAKIYVTINDSDSLATCSSPANNGYFETTEVDKSSQNNILVSFTHAADQEEAWIENRSPKALDFPFSAENSVLGTNMGISSLNCKFEALDSAGRPGDGVCSPSNIHVPPYTKVTVTGGTFYFENGLTEGDYRATFMRTDTESAMHLFVSVTDVPEPVKLTVSSAKARAGEEVTVGIGIENNPGFFAIKLGVNYDANVLRFEGIEDSGLTGWYRNGLDLVWLANEDTNFNGELVKLKFTVLADTETGDSIVTVSCDAGISNSISGRYYPEIQPGKVKVYINIPGDMNGDGEVNILDLIRLRRYIVDPSVEIFMNPDTNGDGELNILDLIRLRRYIVDRTVTIY